MNGFKTVGFSIGMGVFLVLSCGFLALMLCLGRSFPQWAVAVGLAFIVTVSILAGLQPRRRSSDGHGGTHRTH